nr:MAG TPA: hypothetical protein [Caudoviricetes sp.]
MFVLGFLMTLSTYICKSLTIYNSYLNRIYI